VILFLLLVVILLIGLTTAAVMGKISGFMAEPTSSRSFGGIPAGPLSVDGMAHLRFDQALRGYRMDEVDEVIDALSARVRELELEVADLAGTGISSAPADTPDVGGTSPPPFGAKPDVHGEPPE
jgi:DivIVA domain-containing protein